MKLNQSNYFSPEAQMRYMGHSQYLAFRKCEASAMNDLVNPPLDDAAAFRMGHAFDDLFEGKNIQEALTDNGLINTRGRPYADGERLIAAWERVQKEPLFMKLAQGEQQVIRTGNIGGVETKIMMDSYHKGKYIVDRKFVRNFDPIWSDDEGAKVSFVRYWGYDFEAAFYQQAEGNRLPFILACVTKEETPNVALIEVPQRLIDERLQEIEYFAPTYAAIKRGEIEPQRCGRCSHCIETKRLDRIITLDEFEGEF